MVEDTLLSYEVKPDDKYVFLREVIKKEMQLSRALIINLKQQKKILVNGVPTLTNYRLKPADVVSVDITLSEQSSVKPEYMPLDIVYEDQDFLLLNKPPHLAVHPSKGLGAGTLANAVIYYWQAQGKSLLFRPINRLDRDTSGLILIGKSQYAHQAIAYQQKKGIIHREYQAVVEGVMPDDQGCIDLPIARKDPELRERIVDDTGKSALTNYRVLQRFPEHTRLSLLLGSGRTHQIRVHLSYIGHPICGDELYGSPSALIGRQALHAGRLSFIQPRTGQMLQFEAPLPVDIQKLLTQIGGSPQ